VSLFVPPDYCRTWVYNRPINDKCEMCGHQLLAHTIRDDHRGLDCVLCQLVHTNLQLTKEMKKWKRGAMRNRKRYGRT
jgi:hypothetical protein